MAKDDRKTPLKKTEGAAEGFMQPFESLRKEVDRLFEDFDRGGWRSPFHRPRFDMPPLFKSEWNWSSPAVDITDNEQAYEVTAELPGLEDKDVEVSVANDRLTIKGEKHEEKEEEKKDYHLRERHYGTFRRTFGLPEGVDADAITADFKNGVLKVTLPKKPEAQTPEKKIEIKAR